MNNNIYHVRVFCDWNETQRLSLICLWAPAGSCWIFHQKAWALKVDSCSRIINNSWLPHNCIDKTKSLNEEKTPVISTWFKRLSTDHMSWVRCRLNNHCHEKQVWQEQYISWPLFKLKHVGNQIVSVPFDFHCIFCKGNRWEWEPKLFGYKHSSKYLPLWSTEERKPFRWGEYMITELLSPLLCL